MEREVRDNPERQRYELVVDNQIVSIADYERNGDTVTVPHIETDPQHRGQGMADSLMVGVLADLRSRGRRIVPVCPYAAAYLDAHPDQQDLLA
jgi:predicted GNAT family acetyltransferase